MPTLLASADDDIGFWYYYLHTCKKKVKRKVCGNQNVQGTLKKIKTSIKQTSTVTIRDVKCLGTLYPDKELWVLKETLKKV